MFGTPGSRSAGSKRNLNSAGLDSSPGSVDDHQEGDDGDEKKRQPVKRACNECRQQKLRCDVVQEPYQTCSRCRRLNLECKIETNFKRIGKRSRNAEMEREIIELRQQIKEANATNTLLKSQLPQSRHDTASASSVSNHVGNGGPNLYPNPSTEQYMGSHEAVASLLDLRSGYDGSSYSRNSGRIKTIEDVLLASDRVTELFNLFFTLYHPFLPFLDRDKTPDEYYVLSPLLFWMIISVGARKYQTDSNLLTTLAGPVTRLVWSTLADIPQSFHVVKALCLLCTWPFPTNSTSTDPTFMLCGTMMHVAMQLGLHRPSHTHDFSRFRVELIESELRDKVRTWAICNIVAQRVATGYGQPPCTLFDWTLGGGEVVDHNFKLPQDIETRLEIEKLSDKVTKTLYNNRRDPVGLSSDQERPTLVSFLARDLEELEDRLRPSNDVISSLYLSAAHLHLHLSAFFDNPTEDKYRERLLSLHTAAAHFLEAALKLETALGPVLPYTPYYVYQMMLAGGFTLLKLCKSFFSAHIDLEYSKGLFNRTIWAIRGISVASNDLPQRLAEVLAQMWRLGGSPTPKELHNTNVDDSLQLKVRCRMSMSLVYDSVWRWREDAQTKGRNIEAYLKNPTDPDSNNETSATPSIVADHTASTSTPAITTTSDPSLAPAAPLPPNLGITAGNGINNLSNSFNGFGEHNYEVFDPLNWLLDGVMEFPLNYPAISGLETQMS